MNSLMLHKVIQDCFELKLTSDSLFYKSQKLDFKLFEISKAGFELKWESLEKVTYYAVNNKYVIFNQNNETWIVNKDDGELYSIIPITLSLNDRTTSSHIVVGNSKKGICIFDYKNKSYNEYETDDSAIVVQEHLIYCINDIKDSIIVYNDLFSILWQLSITQFGTYKDRIFIHQEPEERTREIYRIYYYNNKIIVTLSRAVIAINPENGALLWKIDFENYNPIELVFHDNTAYLGEYIDYVTIDLEKGIKTFQREATKPMSIVVEGKSISRFKYTGLVYNENYIWFTQGSEGNQFLLKARPENGEVIDGMLLDTKANTYPPVFDENRIYILDRNGILYIYDRITS